MRNDEVEQQLSARLGLTMLPVQPHQFLRVSEAALTAASIVALRVDDGGRQFSGWQIEAAAPGIRPAPHGIYSMAELMALRPLWRAALALPPGWAFRMTGRHLDDAVAPDGATHALNIAVDE